MKLSNATPCSYVAIKFPRWKQRIVGIASYRVKEHNAIDILATDKLGKKYYPEMLYGAGEMIRQCETQNLPGGTKLYLVPISNLEPLERV